MRALISIAAALLLASCASVAPRAPASAPSASADDLHLSGQLSVRVAGDGGNSGARGRATGGNVGFDLIGGPATGQLELSTPFGSLIARAQWRPGDVRLQTTEDERRFDDLDALTRELLGEAVPVAALFDWLRGKPWPQAASQPLAVGAGFEQLGWRIDLSRQTMGVLIATRLADPVVTLRAQLEH